MSLYEKYFFSFDAVLFNNSLIHFDFIYTSQNKLGIIDDTSCLPIGNIRIISNYNKKMSRITII